MRGRGRLLAVKMCLRLFAAIAMVLIAGASPMATAVACSCSRLGPFDPVGSGDVVFIGTVVGEREPQRIDRLDMPEAIYSFDVVRSKTPIESPYDLSVAFGDEASCGFDMAIGEEYLVVASEWEGRLTTNLCSGTVRTERVDPGDLERTARALDAEIVRVSAGSDEPVVPVQLLVVGAVLALVASLSLFAFRREARSG